MVMRRRACVHAVGQISHCNKDGLEVGVDGLSSLLDVFAEGIRFAIKNNLRLFRRMLKGIVCEIVS